MLSTPCGLCNLEYHTKYDGWIWTKEAGWHQWQFPSKEQIVVRLRKRYGLS